MPLQMTQLSWLELKTEQQYYLNQKVIEEHGVYKIHYHSVICQAAIVTQIFKSNHIMSVILKCVNLLILEASVTDILSMLKFCS